MTIVDSIGHRKWTECTRFWGCYYRYGDTHYYHKNIANANTERIFNDIKRMSQVKINLKKKITCL